jgi:hypothetical protein
LYVILYNRQWLAKKELYISAITTILFFIPVIVWNINNHFITFTYHGERVNVAGAGMDIDGFFTFMAGQVFYTNPLIFFCILRALWFKKKAGIAKTQERILLLTSVPLIFAAISISFFKTLLPHWTGPAYSSLVLLTACSFGKRNTTTVYKRAIPLILSLAAVLLLLVLITGTAVINFYPGTLGSKEEQIKGEGDFTLDMYGWKKMGNSFDSIYRSKQINNSAIILCDKWFPAAHIEQYVAGPLNIPVAATGPIEDIHQYYWWNKEIGTTPEADNIFVIVPSNYFEGLERYPLQNYEAIQPDTILQYRNGALARKFYVYYFKKKK